MASAWADRHPRVHVPVGPVPKPITLVLPYYESPTFLQRQYDQWTQFPPPLLEMFRVIVVDDGSPTQQAERLVRSWRPPFSLRLFRIVVDIPWNWLAARNIGAHHAEDGWLLLTDMDHVVPPETVHRLVFGQHDPATVYAFCRREHTGAPVAPHSASFLMTRAMFWSIGGYDERLSGVYGTDGLYRQRLQATAPLQVLTDILIRHEYVEDSSVRLPRKTPEMAEARRRRLARIAPGLAPSVLTFPYREVTW